MEIQELKTYIGVEYKKFDDKGFAYGCLAPVYLLFPDAPRAEFPQGYNWIDSVLKVFQSCCKEISLDEIEEKNIIVYAIPRGQMHIAVYAGNNEIIHITENSTMELSKLSQNLKRIHKIFRYKG